MTVLSSSVVVRNVPALNAEAAVVGQHGAATLHEALGRHGALSSDIRPIQTGALIWGRCITVLAHAGDNLMIHAAIEQCSAGDVLVVANTAPSGHGMVGDLIATSLMSRGVVGLVIDAGVRDVAELRRMGFPVWSRHISVHGTVKATAGSVNLPITIGGQSVAPGDLLVADDDGVVVCPRERLPAARIACEERIAREAAARARLAEGELGLDLYGLRARLADLGVVYVDDLPTR